MAEISSSGRRRNDACGAGAINVINQRINGQYYQCRLSMEANINNG